MVLSMTYFSFVFLLCHLSGMLPAVPGLSKGGRILGMAMLASHCDREQF